MINNIKIKQGFKKINFCTKIDYQKNKDMDMC